MIARTYTLGISRREFARLDGCTETRVRQGISEGRLPVLADGSLDKVLAGTAWRRGKTQRDVSDAPRRRRKPRADAKPAPDHAKSDDAKATTAARCAAASRAARGGGARLT